MASMNLKFDEIEIGTNVNDIDVDPRLRLRVSTGLPFLDYILSGEANVQGLLPGGVYLFTGTPGAGKSTIALQLSDSLEGAGHSAVFNGVEESPAQTKMTYERLGLKNGFTMANATFMDAPVGPKDLVERIGHNTIREHLEAALAAHMKKNAKRKDADKHHLVIVIDSLQACNDGKYGIAMNNKTPIRVLEELTQFAKENYVAIVVIGHVSKNGEFKGDNTLAHMVDGHIHLYVDDDKDSPTEGCRIMEMKKNRFGPTGISVVLDIGRNGLKERGSRTTKGQRV